MLTPKVALEVAYHEGLVREAYKDSVGVWTWSIGITDASGHDVERYIGNPQPLRRCLEVWIWVLERYAKQVSDAFKGHDLTEAQFAAALSFHYNTGAIGKASWVNRYKAGDISGARKAFMNWRKPSEIIPRRQAERDLFFNGIWSGDGTVTEYKVRTNKQPNWASARRVNIEGDVRALLAPVIAPQPPDVEPIDPEPQKPQGGLWAALVAAVIGFLAINRGKRK